MFGGGDNGNPVFPVLLEENRFRYDANKLPQLQLFGEFGGNVNPLNYIGNEHATTTNLLKRGREPEPLSRRQKVQISFNNKFYKDEAAHTGSILNSNPVSTGLKLSYEEDERNSTVTSTDESMKGVLPGTLSHGNILKIEIDQQKEDFDHYIRVQEENIMKGLRELKQRHSDSFLNALEKGIGMKLHEKDVEIENINRKNKELGERLKQVAVEAQSWQHRAACNESVVNVLKSNLRQVIAQSAVQEREGCGDSEVDDAASYVNSDHQGMAGGSGNPFFTKKQLNCRACKRKEVCVLLLPCRHLCLCTDCEGLIDICPICHVMKTTSVQIYMP
ncbi:E3 ubiquitin-protein ligase BOI-like [Cornus florida]|uniref:E3 ubiquitin-protein ligase BOI-like n=1 Tax=Cornus florida TaxID=4283 RepID=UPI0028A064E4|nr:E3 ubiquitin-protein ligase BOI-like [Cornus florida]